MGILVSLSSYMEEPSVALLQDYAYAAALYHDINPQHFLNVITCESGWNTEAHGSQYERGLVQIHPLYWPNEFEKAYDPFFSIDWAAQKFAEGNEHLWSCHWLALQAPEKYQKIALTVRPN